MKYARTLILRRRLRQQSITRHSFKKEDVYGISDVACKDYDRMSLVILRLGVRPTEEIGEGGGQEYVFV